MSERYKVSDHDRDYSMSLTVRGLDEVFTRKNHKPTVA